MKRFLVGADIGNYAFKGVFGEGNRVYIQNAVKEVPMGFERPNLGMEERVLDTMDIIIRSPHLPQLHERRFFVGNLAVGKQEFQPSPDTRKTENPLILVPMLAALALQVNEPEEHIHYEATMGLPMAEFLDKADRQLFEQRIAGDYQIEFVSTMGMEGWRVNITLEPSITAEGLAVIHHQMTDRYGRNVRPEWQGQAMGAIDIGGFSVDISGVDSSHRPDVDLCAGLELGTVKALDGIISEIYRQYRVRLPRHMIEKTVTKDNCQLQLGARRVDIRPIVENNFRVLANQIIQGITEISKRPKATQVHRYFVLDGGALNYQQYMADELQSKLFADLVWLTHDPEETIFLNAEAFYRLALMRAFKKARNEMRVAKEA